jgi:hypothetical protein
MDKKARLAPGFFMPAEVLPILLRRTLVTISQHLFGTIIASPEEGSSVHFPPQTGRSDRRRKGADCGGGARNWSTMGGFFKKKWGFLRAGERLWTPLTTGMHASVASPSLAEMGIYSFTSRSLDGGFGQVRRQPQVGKRARAAVNNRMASRQSERN